MKLILLGAPGAGKGTQAAILSKLLNIPTVSTGNILRAAQEMKTPLGEQVTGYMNQGRLVPDDVVLSILAERLTEPDCKNGFILDGVPRTLAQAETMEKNGISDGARVIALEISEEALQARLAGRRVCIKCGESYHVDIKPPKTEAVCDSCGSAVVQRVDDEPAMARRRMEVYHADTEPLKEFYRQRGALVTIITKPTIEENTQLIVAALGL